jgi:hypothetical protein
MGIISFHEQHVVACLMFGGRRQCIAEWEHGERSRRTHDQGDLEVSSFNAAALCQ